MEKSSFVRESILEEMYFNVCANQQLLTICFYGTNVVMLDLVFAVVFVAGACPRINCDLLISY